MPITILIADDQSFVRAGIRSELLRYPEFCIAGEAGDGNETFQLAIRCCPEILLVEIQMYGVDIQTICQTYMQQSGKTLRIIVVTSDARPDTVAAALIAGARGYVLKMEEPSALIQTIRMVSQGKTWLSPASVELLATKISCRSGNNPRPLSDREIEILSLLGQGLNNTQVAGELRIAERTVRYHVEKVIDKLGVNNRVEAVARATQNGWITN